MKHLIVVFLALSVLAGSVWPAGMVGAQEEPTGGGAADGQSSSPPTAETPQEEAPPAEEQYAAPPAAPIAPEEQAIAAEPASSPEPAPTEPAPTEPVPSEPVPSEPAPETEPAPEAASEPVPSPVSEPAPQTGSTQDPASPSAGQYAQEIPPSSEEPAAPVTSEGPLPPDPQPAEAPQGEPVPVEDDGAVEPASHCGDGLFGPGPPEGTPCDAPADPPPPDDPYQYQYTPVTDPTPPANGEQDPSDPQPIPDEEPPAEEPTAEEPPVEEPAPAPTEPPGSYEVGDCANDHHCGIEGVPEDYSCVQVYAGGPEGGDAPHHYECYSAKGFVEEATSPDGQTCYEVLYFENPDSEGQTAYKCEDARTDRTCVYDTSWGELVCGTNSDGIVGTPTEESCGEDRCGLDVPSEFECFRTQDEQGAIIGYVCGQYSIDGPNNSQCEGYVEFDENGEPRSGAGIYQCQEPRPGLGSCRVYDRDWNYVEDCEPGGGGGGTDAGFQNSDEAGQVISKGRRPAPNPAARNNNPTVNTPTANALGDSGSGENVTQSPSDVNSTGETDAPISNADPTGDASNGSAPSAGPANDNPTVGVPEGGSTGEAPEPGPAAPAPEAEPAGGLLAASLLGPDVAGANPGNIPAGANPAGGPADPVAAVLLGAPVPDGAPEARSARAATDTGAATASPAAPGTSAIPNPGANDGEDPVAVDEGVAGEQPILVALMPYRETIGPLVDVNNPRLARAQEQEKEEHGFVDREDVRRVALASSFGDAGADPRGPVAGGAPAGDRSPKGDGRPVASPGGSSSLTAAALALFAAVGTVLIVGRARLGGNGR